jgi:uncharacterized protein YjbI with pentapeptide repeats
MEHALTASRRMIAVVSPYYLDRNSYGFIERIEAVRIAHRRPEFLIPVLVAEFELPPILGGMVHINLVNLDEVAAREQLIAGLGGYHLRSSRPSPWPGREAVGGTLESSSRQAVFPAAIQPDENMSGRDLLALDLRNSILGSIDFSDANLRSANFASARLTGINLQGADLRGSNFTDARLSNPNLDGARLEGSQWGRALLVTPSLGDNLGTSELSDACILPRDSPPLEYGPSGIVTALAFSPDGGLLIAGWGSDVVLISVPKREIIRVLRGRVPLVNAVAFHPDGETFASGGDDGIVRVWSAIDGQLITELSHSDGHATVQGSRINAITFNSDGVLAVGGSDGVVRLWQDTKQFVG